MTPLHFTSDDDRQAWDGYATAALSKLIANGDPMPSPDAGAYALRGGQRMSVLESEATVLAHQAAAVADAMLRERRERSNWSGPPVTP